MLRSSRYDWKLVTRVSVVIAPVFAALLSSWVGIEAERRAKEAVAEASVLERRVFEISLRAFEVDALYDRLVVESSRQRIAADEVTRERYGAGVAALHWLADEVSARVERAAAETSGAGERAQMLLIISGSVSLQLALYLARSLGEALTKAGELMDRLAEMARIDALTGLPNGGVWDEEFGKGLDRARRTGRTCTIGLVDLDHFKRYNDTHGHQAGDQLLREAAQALARRMRAGDLIARYGGEEFAVVLYGCDSGSALKFFARLHGAMPQGQTFSAGVSHTEGREPGDEVVRRANEALYRAKAERRDRTVAHQDAAAA